MIKKIITALLIIAALMFFVGHTLHYGAVIRQRDKAAMYQWRLNHRGP